MIFEIVRLWEGLSSRIQITKYYSFRLVFAKSKQLESVKIVPSWRMSSRRVIRRMGCQICSQCFICWPQVLVGRPNPLAQSRACAGVAGGVGDERATTRLEAPLVGRAWSWRGCAAALEDAIAARACRLVTVIGSPGLGKSPAWRRSSRERVAGRARGGVAAIVSRAARGSRSCRSPRCCARSAGIAEADDAGRCAREAARRCRCDGDPDRERLVERAAALLGRGRAGLGAGDVLGVRRGCSIARSSGRWSSCSTTCTGGSRCSSTSSSTSSSGLRDAPMLLLALARPELRETREVLTAVGRRASDVIELEPLDPSTAGRSSTVCWAASDLPPELLDTDPRDDRGQPAVPRRAAADAGRRGHARRAGRGVGRRRRRRGRARCRRRSRRC